jgi:hypothetical protein
MSRATASVTRGNHMNFAAPATSGLSDGLRSVFKSAGAVGMNFYAAVLGIAPRAETLMFSIIFGVVARGGIEYRRKYTISRANSDSVPVGYHESYPGIFKPFRSPNCPPLD